MHPYLDSFWPLDTVFRVIIETSNVYKLYQYIITILSIGRITLNHQYRVEFLII